MTRIAFKSRTWRRGKLGLLLLVGLAGCGGGNAADIVETLVKLITARFVPNSATLAPGASSTVQLEITCSTSGLDTPFGRLGVRVKLDPEHHLPSVLTATLSGGAVTGSDGFALFPCNTPTGDPELRLAQIPVQIQAAAGSEGLSTTLAAFVEVEPLATGEPSKDSTLAEMTITIASAVSPGAPATGGCCTGGACSVTTSAACTAGGGVYQGDNSGCVPGLCATDDQGACCYGSFCVETTTSTCQLEFHGTFKGVGTSCTPNPCPQ